MTQTTQILKKLNQMYGLLEQANYDVGIFDEENARAEWTNRQAYARTFMSLSGSMELRKQQAILDTSDEDLEAELAGVRLRAAKDRVRMLGLQMEILRSMNAAAQREFMTEPIGQYT